jgi:hypothetical protein
MLLEDLDRHAVERGASPCLVHWENGGSKVQTFSDFAAISDRLAGAVRRLARPARDRSRRARQIRMYLWQQASLRPRGGGA